MTTYHEFSMDAVNHALEAAQRHNDLLGFKGVNANMSIYGGGELSLKAQCISVTVENGQVCLSLPLGIGKVCIPIPLPIPSGTAAEACLDICTTWGIPTGVKVTVSALGHVIVTKTFGKC